MLFLRRVLQRTNGDEASTSLAEPQRHNIDVTWLMTLIVRARELHVTTDLSQSTLHLLTANERTRLESDWKQICSYDSYNFLYKRRPKTKSKRIRRLWSLKVVMVKQLSRNGKSYHKYACLCRRFSLVILEKGLENSTENSILGWKSYSITEISLYST